MSLGGPTDRVSLSALLEHREWVRTLARSLVSDPHRADDVEQETWRMALERPPRHQGSLRAWFSTVVRNAARKAGRGEGRRARHEAFTPSSRPILPPDVVVAEAEVQHRLVRAVLDLPEPARTTVLLRYFEGLEAAAIARRMHVPVETVRTRLKRAVAQLRERMQAELGEDREAWGLLLVGMGAGGGETAKTAARASATRAMAGGVLAMTTTTKLGLAAALVLVVAAFALWKHDGADSAASQATETASARSDTAGRRHAPELTARVTGPDASLPVPEAIARSVQPNGVRVVGRVVDDRRRPVREVEIRANRRGAVGLVTKTGMDGRFGLDVGPRPVAHSGLTGMVSLRGDVHVLGIHANAPNGAAAVAHLMLPPTGASTEDAGTLILGSAGDVVVQVTSGGAPAKDVEVWIGPDGGGRSVEARTDERGTAMLRSVPRERLVVGAYAKGRGRAHAELPADATAVEPRRVALAIAPRAIRVLVVDAGTGKPRPGERLVVQPVTRIGPAGNQYEYPAYDPPLIVAPTGEDGSTRIDDMALDDSIYVDRFEEGRTFPRHDFHEKLTTRGVDEARIEVAPRREIRWKVESGDCPPPPVGTVLPVVGYGWEVIPEGLRCVRVESGELVAEGVGPENFRAYAVAPDGSTATLGCNTHTSKGWDTKFVRGQIVEIVLREENGARAVGIEVILKRNRSAPIVEPRATDAEGRVSFRGVNPDLGDGGTMEVGARMENEDRRYWRPIGTLDLRQGDVCVSWTIPAPRNVVLRVTLRGERRLPTRYSIGVGHGGISGVVEDPELAELRFRARPQRRGEPIEGWLEGDDCQQVRFAAPPGPSDVDAVIDVALVKRQPIRVRFRVVLPPTARVDAPISNARAASDASGDESRFALERWRESGAKWSHVCYLGVARRRGTVAGPDSNGFESFGPADPGRFRIRDATTGAVSPSVDVGPDDDPPLVLDLSHAGMVRGRVEAPQGADLKEASVLVEGEGLVFDEPPPRTVMVDAGTGAFAVAVPGDRVVRLRVEHPSLAADRSEGVAEVVAPHEGVSLRLVPGATLSFRPLRCDGPKSPDDEAHVMFLRDDGKGEPIVARPLVASGDRLIAGGFPAGAYTLWLDVPGAAPRILRGVQLGVGATDLGEVSFAQGATVRVRMDTVPGEVPPRMRVEARRLDEPRIFRALDLKSGAEVVLPGLVAGRYEVKVNQTVATVECDGEHDVVIDYALR